ncbi:MAG: cupin domain-containing protein [Beijerinckiaceae bacterium]
MSEQTTNLSRRPICMVLRARAPFIGKQGFSYAPAVSAETVGASAIHMQLLTIPPGGRAKAHKHAAHETAIYVLSGEGAMYYGERLDDHLIARPGDFIYIPANVPHQPYNVSQTEPCLAVVARTDPNEQESVMLLPELDTLHM